MILALCFDSPTPSLQSVSISSFWLRPPLLSKASAVSAFWIRLPTHPKRADVILEHSLKQLKTLLKPTLLAWLLKLISAVENLIWNCGPAGSYLKNLIFCRLVCTIPLIIVCTIPHRLVQTNYILRLVCTVSFRLVCTIRFLNLLYYGHKTFWDRKNVMQMRPGTHPPRTVNLTQDYVNNTSMMLQEYYGTTFRLLKAIQLNLNSI